MNKEKVNTLTCDFGTLLALEDQMPRERFEQIKQARPDFAVWLNEQRQADVSDRSVFSGDSAKPCGVVDPR